MSPETNPTDTCLKGLIRIKEDLIKTNQHKTNPDFDKLLINSINIHLQYSDGQFN